MTAADAPRLAQLCRDCTAFIELIEGEPGGPETAASLLGPLPTTFARGTRTVYGLERGQALLGVVELLAGYPQPKAWYVGLLLLRPEARGAGTGTTIWKELRQKLQREGAEEVRLIVQMQNPRARRFWERQGFVVEREITATAGRLESPTWLLHLSLAESA